MACIELYARGKTVTLKSKDLTTCGFPKKLQIHPPKPAEAKPSFRKVSLPPVNCMLFLAHLWVREFWPQMYSL